MNCENLECGPDPVCGKECGSCVAGQNCQGGQCVTSSYGALGDPCVFGDVNIAAGDCATGLECLGIPADGNAGTCPGGASSECTNLLEEWNIDCVGGNCGASFCSEPCDARGDCPPGFVGQDVGNPPVCMCIPGPYEGPPNGDACPWNNVNADYDDCQAGMACLGNEDIGSCPGGTDAECNGVPDTWNPDCVNGICGFSFCSDECDAQGDCPAGFDPAQVSDTCYCIPQANGTSQAGEPCPFGEINTSYDFCISGLICLGNNNTGNCPGGTAAECDIPDAQNPDCVNEVCGFSFCSGECDEQGNCPAGFWPQEVGGTCYCIPSNECDVNGNCPSGFLPEDIDGTCYCMPA